MSFLPTIAEEWYGIRSRCATFESRLLGRRPVAQTRSPHAARDGKTVLVTVRGRSGRNSAADHLTARRRLVLFYLDNRPLRNEGLFAWSMSNSCRPGSALCRLVKRVFARMDDTFSRAAYKHVRW